MNVLPEHLALIKKILKMHLPVASKVYVFGSRVTGKAKKYSDLDLAIDKQGMPLSLSERACLEEAFQESYLPYKVDLLDWNSASKEFKAYIDQDKIDLDI